MNQITPLKIIFAGTPGFAATALQALIHSHHQIVAVYTQPDRPAGRGRKLTASPVKELAEKHNLDIYQPLTLRNEDEQKKLASLNADIMIVVAYGLLLPTPVLTSPRLGCINVHASLLPKWRGAAPIQRAILAGDKTTGITLMQMDEGLDTGNMLYKVEYPISEHDTSETVHDHLAELGAEALLHTLASLNEIKSEVQDSSLATYAHKIKKEEAQLDWNLSAQELAYKVRAFNPWPIASSNIGEKIVRFWQVEVLDNQIENATPGMIVNSSTAGIDIATKKGILRLLKLQLPGGKVLSAADILNAQREEFAKGKFFITHYSLGVIHEKQK